MSTGTSLRDFVRAGDFERMPEEIAVRLRPEGAEGGVAVYGQTTGGVLMPVPVRAAAASLQSQAVNCPAWRCGDDATRFYSVSSGAGA